MANIKSAEKRVLTSQKAHDRNVAQRSAVKTARRKVLDAVARKDFEAARTLLREAESIIAKACQKGVIKKNAAARRVSRLTHFVVTNKNQAAA